MKRFFDIFFVLIIFPVIFIVCLITAFFIKINLGSPVLFIQPRPGLNGKIFNLIKFRTMTEDLSRDGQILSDSERLTSFGKFLRSTSIDELPTLWNVLRGDMSLVGPRPLLVDYLPLYSVRQFKRHNVRPGITGWAQINGRNTTTWDERFEMDVWYTKNCSIFLDFKIILITIIKVIKREGITQSGESTMNKFKGNL
jgi:lipopolysaccharide/colanic/teichoic acid biosynthesis glycosyltransferase